MNEATVRIAIALMLEATVLIALLSNFILMETFVHITNVGLIICTLISKIYDRGSFICPLPFK
jgi:hypothetical protein